MFNSSAELKRHHEVSFSVQIFQGFVAFSLVFTDNAENLDFVPALTLDPLIHDLGHRQIWAIPDNDQDILSLQSLKGLLEVCRNERHFVDANVNHGSLCQI